jgi:hypothetical protein
MDFNSVSPLDIKTEFPFSYHIGQRKVQVSAACTSRRCTGPLIRATQDTGSLPTFLPISGEARLYRRDIITVRNGALLVILVKKPGSAHFA